MTRQSPRTAGSFLSLPKHICRTGGIAPADQVGRLPIQTRRTSRRSSLSLRGRQAAAISWNNVRF